MAKTTVDQAIKEIAWGRKAIKLAETQVRTAVGHARQSGASWAEIGAALGVSKQAAQRRYGGAN